MTAGRRRAPRRPAPRGPRGTSWVGRRFEVEVERVAHGGHCVARHEGRVVFVRHALPGERVVAEVTGGTDRTSFLRADAVEVLTPSPRRRPAPCPVSGPGGCGGCDWQHTDAAYGRELKAAAVREQLQRLAGLDLPVVVEQVPGDEEGLRWRTRLELSVDEAGVPGLHPHRSHRVLPLTDCLIATDAVVGSGALTQRHPGARSVHVAASSTGEVAVVPVPAGDDEPRLHEEVALPGHRLELQVGARGFWQVHPGAAATFVRTAVEMLRPRTGETVLDLYAGVGLFAAELARRVGPQGRVVAVEGDEAAVADARANLAPTGWAQVVHHDVAGWLEQDVPEADADLVVLDPPRSGAGPRVVEAVLGRAPRAVVYVACDPAALARDLAAAAGAGYRLGELRAFDAFPMTHHVECLALLVPQGTGAGRGPASGGGLGEPSRLAWRRREKMS